MIDRIEAKRKLSQNRDQADVDGAIAGLEAGSPRDHAVADLMRRVYGVPGPMHTATVETL